MATKIYAGYVSATTMKIPFGKHKGSELGDVPEQYLEWLAGVDWLREPLASAVKAEAERRILSQENRQSISPRLVDELVCAGVRTLSKKYHPDHGGDHKQMVEINRTADWLRQQARVLA
jgi:hypothetical protein